jgi:hypothetical protein
MDPFFHEARGGSRRESLQRACKVCPCRKIKCETSPGRWSKTCGRCKEKSLIREIPSYGWYMYDVLAQT